LRKVVANAALRNVGVVNEIQMMNANAKCPDFSRALLPSVSATVSVPVIIRVSYVSMNAVTEI